MITAAEIIFRNTHGEGFLDWLLAELSSHLSIPVSRTEWRGFVLTIPQIHVATSPVPLTIQLNEAPDCVPAEITELADDLRVRMPEPQRVALASLTARLEVMSATPVEPQLIPNAFSVEASTYLDPSQPQVAQVLQVLAELTHGFTVDCIAGQILPPGASSWIPLSQS